MGGREGVVLRFGLVLGVEVVGCFFHSSASRIGGSWEVGRGEGDEPLCGLVQS